MAQLIRVEPRLAGSSLGFWGSQIKDGPRLVNTSNGVNGVIREANCKHAHANLHTQLPHAHTQAQPHGMCDASDAEVHFGSQQATQDLACHMMAIGWQAG